MSSEILKRIISSIALIGIFLFCYFIHDYVFLTIILFAFLICWIEWIGIVNKIYIKNTILKNLSFLFSFMYLLIAGVIIYGGYQGDKILFLALLFTCIFSDIGGYFVGKNIGGKKLTKISPNKTISGSIGSFLFSLIPFVYYVIYHINSDLSIQLILLPILFSFLCQLGDLFISFFKRKAKIKDISKLIPGHGGLLDRIDGIIFAMPIGILLLQIFI